MLYVVFVLVYGTLMKRVLVDLFALGLVDDDLDDKTEHNWEYIFKLPN